MRRLLCLLLVAFSACETSNPENSVRIVAQTSSQADEETMHSALAILVQHCKGVRIAGPDIESASARFRSGEVTWQREYGWDRMIEVEAKIVAAPQILKTKAGGDYPGGHTCYFALGGGQKPGIDVGKSACQAVCGMDGQFKPVPELAFVR